MGFLLTAGIGLAVKGVSALIAGHKANKARKDAQNYENKIAELEANRQQIVNPYEGIKDLSAMLSNPYANLSVATKAAEMQVEQADISLANTLDTIRATGAGAGGATALAQAALKSKQGVAASIESQEVANEKLRAQGEEKLQQAKMTEAQRIQSADVAGKQFVYSEREKRELQQLDRTQAQYDTALAQQYQYQSDMMGALGGIGSSAIDMAGIQADLPLSTETNK